MTTKQYFVGTSPDPNYVNKEDFWFSPDATRAYRFAEVDADTSRTVFNSKQVHVQSATFESHRCVFEAEKVESDYFVLFCNMPFEPVQDNPANRMKSQIP